MFSPDVSQLPPGLESAFAELGVSTTSSKATIVGLKKNTDINGLVCSKEQFNEETKRWTCSYTDGDGKKKKISIKPGNLKEM